MFFQIEVLNFYDSTLSFDFYGISDDTDVFLDQPLSRHNIPVDLEHGYFDFRNYRVLFRFDNPASLKGAYLSLNYIELPEIY